MVRRCLINGCTKYKIEGTSLHRFPGDTKLAEEWASNIRNFNKQQCSSEYNKNSFVCGWHFEPHCKISLAEKVFLKTTAVPTLFEQSGQIDETIDNGDGDIKHMHVGVDMGPEDEANALDSITIVKCEPFDMDMVDQSRPEDGNYCLTETTDSSSTQSFDMRQNTHINVMGKTDYSPTKRMFKCEQCGHMNTIAPALKDGFFDNSQSFESSQSTTVFQVSLHPESCLPSQSNQLLTLSHPNGSHVNDVDLERFDSADLEPKKKKRLIYPGDVRDDEELGEQSAQKYISVLRKTVMDQRKQTKTLMQQNRRYQQRVSKLKTLLKDLIERTKSGHYIIEAPS